MTRRKRDKLETRANPLLHRLSIPFCDWCLACASAWLQRLGSSLFLINQWLLAFPRPLYPSPLTYIMPNESRTNGIFASYAFFGKMLTFVPWVGVDFVGRNARHHWEMGSGAWLIKDEDGINYITSIENTTVASLQLDRDS